MATKTITIDLEAYERLKAHKRKNESFSQTIKRLVHARVDVEQKLRRLHRFTMDADAAEAVEDRLRRRESPWNSMNYVVGSFDLLGVSNALCEFQLVPPDDAEAQKLGEVMGSALAAVCNFRRAFSQTVNDFRTAWRQVTAAGGEAPTGSQAMSALTDCHLGLDQFSDLVVVGGRLNSRDGRVSVWPALAIIVGSAVTMIRALASGVPFRGGIEIGVGSDWPELELLGSALVKAHRLEEGAAGWPRILVGKVTVEFVQSFRAQPQADHFGNLNRHFAKQAASFVCRAGDGRLMVDFLGKAFARRFLARPQRDEYCQLVQQAYQFVSSEVKRFRRNHDDKYARRYEALQRYFRSRLPLWQ